MPAVAPRGLVHQEFIGNGNGIIASYASNKIKILTG
ncbi:MAG: hypothetical protein RL156_1369, partial [Bacteroidota bacterium]